MEAGGMVVVDGVADVRAASSGTGSATGRCARCRSPIWSGWPGSLPNGIADRFALRVPLRGTVVQPSLRAATVPAGGVLLRAKGWGVEVAGRAVRLFDPWLSESIRCGFPEIPKPGRSRRRKGRRAGRGRKALRRVRSAVPGGFARGSPLRLSDGRSSFACGRVFWSRASILDSGLPDDPARSGTGRISRERLEGRINRFADVRFRTAVLPLPPRR